MGQRVNVIGVGMVKFQKPGASDEYNVMAGNAICEAIKEFKGNSLITALPCQSNAMKKVRKNKGYVFGLFCSKAHTSDLTR